MCTEDSKRLRKYVGAILLYFFLNPQARDTLEGIRLWIGSGTDELVDEEIEEALADMMRRNWITARTSPVSGTLYGLSPMLEEVFMLLRGQS